jgi:hypothetical protein
LIASLGAIDRFFLRTALTVLRLIVSIPGSAIRLSCEDGAEPLTLHALED